MTRVRLRRVSLRFALETGALIGFVVGLFIGSLLGALVAWVAGALLDWQRQLAFTLGVNEVLLPLGEQQGLLQAVQSAWWLVIPAFGLLVGALSALAGGLGTAFMVALFNRLGEGTEVAVDLAETDEAPELAEVSREARLLPSESGGRSRAARSSAPPPPAPPTSGQPPRGTP